MNVNVFLFCPKAKPGEWIWANENGVEAALADIRQHWNEEPEGSQAFILTDDNGNFLASIHRLPWKAEIAVTLHADGRVEQHLCEYLFDENGKWLCSVVTFLESPMSETIEVINAPVQIHSAGGNDFQVWLKVGIQSFPVGVPQNREEALWYANQLSHALEKYVDERIQNRLPPKKRQA